MKITHDHLQELAQRLLKGKTRRFEYADDNQWGFSYDNLGGCMIVASEMSGHGEFADAIGWGAGGYSTLIECKASRADFLRDSEKHCRRYPEMGMGSRRYYLTTANVISDTDDLNGWGHLEAHHPSHLTKLVFRRTSKRFEPCRRSEIAAMMQAMRMGAGLVDHHIGSAFVYFRPWRDETHDPVPAIHSDSAA